MAVTTKVTYDVAVIGAGVVGCAIARALSQFELDVVVIEAGDDVGIGTTKANSAILHTGFDTPVGSLEATLVARGHHLLTAYAAETGIPLVRTGATLVAWNDDDIISLERIRSEAIANGYHSTAPLRSGEVYDREPKLGPGVVAGLAIPDESVICPFTTPLALATEAVDNGVKLLLRSPVTSAVRDPSGSWRVLAGGREVRTEWVVNAAGLAADSVAELLGDAPFRVSPRRGQFVVFDKSAAALVSGIILGVPSPRSKGVLLAPTVFGNLLLGPTAEDVRAKDATETTEEGLAYLLERGKRLVPRLSEMEVTSIYAGLRAVSDRGGYDVAVDAEGRYGRVAGIRSTGLSASLAIAELLLDQLSDAGLPMNPKPDHVAVRMPPIGDSQARTYCDETAIGSDPSAGRVICFCEMTTLADLESALHSPVPPTSLDGLFRRTRATGGRCQGFYCRPQITSWLATKLGKTQAELLGTTPG